MHNVEANTYTLQLFSGTGIMGFDSLTEDNLIYDTKDLFNIEFSDDGSISYTLESMDLGAVTGDGVWSAMLIDEHSFSNGRGVNFTADAALSVSGDITSAQIVVESGNTVILSEHTAGSTLASPLIQLEGTLYLKDGLLTDASKVFFRTGGTLKLDDAVTLNTQISSIGGAAMQFEVTSGTATLTQQLTDATSMSVSGSGTLDLSGSLLAGASTTTINDGASLRIGSGSNSTDLKKIRGTGTLIFAGNDGNTYLDVDGFAGAVQLEAGATGLRFNENQTSGSRFSLENIDPSQEAVSVTIFGDDGAGNNGLLLDKLSGNINISSTASSSANRFQRNHIDLEMTEDNRWTGSWATDTDNSNNGYLVVDSTGATQYTFTITQGQKESSANGRWNRLEIQNAKVLFEESAEWKGAIVFDHSDAVLELAGNSITFDTVDRNGEAANFQSTAEGHGEIIVNVGEGGTVTINQTNNTNDEQVLDSGINAYSGAITVKSGTLFLQAANAFDYVDSITVNMTGTLSMNNVAHVNNVSMGGGTFTKASEWTGALTIEAAASASVTSSHIANNAITLETDATLDLQDTVVGAGKITGTSGNTINLVDSGISFDAANIEFIQPTSTASASASPAHGARTLEQITDTSLDSMLVVKMDTSWTNIDSMIVSGDLYLELNLSEEQFALFDSNVLTNGVAFALTNDPAIDLDVEGVATIYIALRSGDRYELHTSQKYGTTVGDVDYMIVVPVPEPSTGVMSLLALTGLLARRRRRS